MANFIGNYDYTVKFPNVRVAVNGVRETARTSTTATFDIDVAVSVRGTLSGRVDLRLWLGDKAQDAIVGSGDHLWQFDGGTSGSNDRWGVIATRTFTGITFNVAGAPNGSAKARIKLGAVSVTGVAVDTGVRYIDYSRFNTAPTMSGSVSTNPSGTIAENINSIALSWTKASDADDNVANYIVQRSENGQGWSNVGYPTTNSFNDTVVPGAGKTYDYRVQAKDSLNLYSNFITSSRITTNVMTAATLASTASINFDTDTFAFNWSGAKNTNGNTSFTYKIRSNDITVYNQAVSGTSTSISVWKSGAYPSSPYIKFEDIKTKLKGSQYKGTLSFILDTTNAYGTTKSTSKALSVNLQVAPSAFVNLAILRDSNKSSCYKMNAETGAYYFVPDGTNTTYLSWEGADDQLGGAINYTIQVSIDGSAYSTIASGIQVKYYNYKPTKELKKRTLKFKVIANTSYSLSGSAECPVVSLDYYDGVSISNIAITTRADTSADVQLQVTTKTSISNMNTSGTWSLKENTAIKGNLSVAQTVQTIKVTGLVAANTYTVNITYNDKTGWSADKSTSVAIGAAVSIMEITREGVGIGGITADSTNKLKVKGDSNFEGKVVVKGDMTPTTINGINTTNYYSTSNKPTPSVIGALPVANPIATGDIKTDGRVISETPGGSSIYIQSNPANNVPRLRFGGSGTGSDRLEIQAAGDVRVGQFSKGGFVAGNAADTTETVNSIETRNKHAGMYISAGDNFGLYDWTNGRSILQYNFANNAVTLHGKNVMYAISGNGGYYCMAPNGSETSWVRTTTAGIIPNASGGNSSSLGTEGWQFNNIWAQSFRITSVAQVFSGYGTNYLYAGGTGDSVNYGQNNMRTRCHNGWGISDNYDNTNAVIDARNGRFIGKSAYWHNSSKCLKSDIRGIPSETMPITLNLARDEIVDENLTMELIQDFLDNVNIKTYVSDFKQEGVSQLDADSTKGHIKQIGYIADEMANHPIFPYIGEKMAEFDNETGEKKNDLIAINSTALTSVVIAGYQMERARSFALQQEIDNMKAELAEIKEIMVAAGLVK